MRDGCGGVLAHGGWRLTSVVFPEYDKKDGNQVVVHHHPIDLRPSLSISFLLGGYKTMLLCMAYSGKYPLKRNWLWQIPSSRSHNSHCEGGSAAIKLDLTRNLTLSETSEVIRWGGHDARSTW